MVHRTISNKSLINERNNNAPKLDPCETPDVAMKMKDTFFKILEFLRFGIAYLGGNFMFAVELNFHWSILTVIKVSNAYSF